VTVAAPFIVPARTFVGRLTWNALQSVGTDRELSRDAGATEIGESVSRFSSLLLPSGAKPEGNKRRARFVEFRRRTSRNARARARALVRDDSCPLERRSWKTIAAEARTSSRSPSAPNIAHPRDSPKIIPDFGVLSALSRHASHFSRGMITDSSFHCSERQSTPYSSSSSIVSIERPSVDRIHGRRPVLLGRNSTNLIDRHRSRGDARQGTTRQAIPGLAAQARSGNVKREREREAENADVPLRYRRGTIVRRCRIGI